MQTFADILIKIFLYKRVRAGGKVESYINYLNTYLIHNEGKQIQS